MRRIETSGSAPGSTRARRRITRFVFYSALIAALSATDAVIVSRSGASVEQDPAQAEPPPESTPSEFPKENRGNLVAPADSSPISPGGAVADSGLGPGPEDGATYHDEPDSSAEGAMPDTGAVLMQTPAAADSGAPLDTLRLITPTTNGAGRPSTPPPAAPPKARTGVLGLHPAAILLGLAALQYFIVKAATD